jgi:hypothetical protein
MDAIGFGLLKNLGISMSLSPLSLSGKSFRAAQTYRSLG